MKDAIALHARRLATRLALAVREAPARVKRELVLRRPRGRLEWASVAFVTSVFLAYLVTWTWGYASALFDPGWQADDARTALFPFHRYAPGAPLADDPIANEMIEYQPYFVRFLYWLLVPLFGLLAAAKVVQGGLFLLLLVAGGILAFSRRAGLGAGLLFAFLFLHDYFVAGRIGGALPRSFGFPTIALWLAGALAYKPWVRRSAALLAAGTYPPALALILGGEGLYSLRSLGRPGWNTTERRLLAYAALVAGCAVVLAPSVLFAGDGGPIHTLAQARNNPAFGQTGRLEVLPFQEPGPAMGKAFLRTFQTLGHSPIPALQALTVKHEDLVLCVLVMAVMILPLARLAPTPSAVICFFAAIMVLYALAMAVAFKMYSPMRYYYYGMRAAALGLAASSLGLLMPRWRLAWRQPLRNFVAGVLMLASWVCFGDGVTDDHPLGMSFHYRRDQELWEFIQSLPEDARLASHIRDGDSIPLFGLRANNGAAETIQPWLTLSWERQKKRAEDTLRALYATDRKALLAFCRKYQVSHLFLKKSRYDDDFFRSSRSFEPFTGFAQTLLEGRKLSDLVLAELPESAVVFEWRQYRVVDVKLLEQAWSAARRKPASPKP